MTNHPTAAERVRMERNESVRHAMKILTTDYDDAFTRDDVRSHVVQVMLHSVIKQARWSAGLEVPA